MKCLTEMLFRGLPLLALARRMTAVNSGGATMGQKGAIAPLFFLLKY
jgi:hypothetical protein